MRFTKLLRPCLLLFDATFVNAIIHTQRTNKSAGCSDDIRVSQLESQVRAFRDKEFHNAATIEQLETQMRDLKLQLARYAHLDKPLDAVEHQRTNPTSEWRRDKGGGAGAWVGALAFVCLVGSPPLILQAASGEGITVFYIVETIIVYTWLIGGLVSFTNGIEFNSIHFSEPRTLALEEAVYFFAQVLTTVGYGDITPAHRNGQTCVALFVLTSILFAASMVSELIAILTTKMHGILEQYDGGIEDQAGAVLFYDRKLRDAFKPLLVSFLSFFLLLCIGASFFHLYPGEDKTIREGIYMSVITLATVGFGAFTPVTHGGMVFGAFWMLFGVGALGACVASFGAFKSTLKNYERHMTECSTARSSRVSGDLQSARSVGAHQTCSGLDVATAAAT